MSNVYKIYKADNPDHVLEQAMGNFGAVLIIGYDKSGELDVRSDTGIDKADALWLLKHVEWKLLNGDYDETT